MTTAHRPTWNQALGGPNQGGNSLVSTTKVSSKFQPTHQKLKLRSDAGTSEFKASRIDHKRALEEREAETALKKSRNVSIEAFAKTLGVTQDETAKLQLQDNPFPEDADDLGTGNCGYSSNDSDDEQENDDSELLLELEAIKKERELEMEQNRAAENKLLEKVNKQKAVRGNPLLMNGGDEDHFGMYRRWDDDVVFKNQCKNRKEPNKDTFINDTVRSPFHRKFLAKYIG